MLESLYIPPPLRLYSTRPIGSHSACWKVSISPRLYILRPTGFPSPCGNVSMVPRPIGSPSGGMSLYHFSVLLVPISMLKHFYFAPSHRYLRLCFNVSLLLTRLSIAPSHWVPIFMLERWYITALYQSLTQAITSFASYKQRLKPLLHSLLTNKEEFVLLFSRNKKNYIFALFHILSLFLYCPASLAVCPYAALSNSLTVAISSPAALHISSHSVTHSDSRSKFSQPSTHPTKQVSVSSSEILSGLEGLLALS